MAKKPSPEKPAPSSLLPGFQHLIPSAAASPLAAHIRPLFLPDLVQQIARNKQIDANRREQAHPAFRKWAKDLKQGVLQQLHETQVEQDFNHVLLRGLGYTTQSDVASDQHWTLTPKWNVPGSGEVDAALGKFRLDESGWLSGEPLVMVELKGAKVDLDRKMPTRNITPVQQRTPPGPPTRYWRKTRSTWNGAETTAAANSVGVSSSRTRIQRSSRSGVRTGWWVMSRFRSGCRDIRVEPCNGGVVGHPSPGGRRLAFRRKVFGTQA